MSTLYTALPPVPSHHVDMTMSMFGMAHPSPQYPFQQAPLQPPPRQYSGHGTSSAFSSSANPDEDWTKISDLAERRRIQNRIAQRNYRKKLKRRLEDLERRAGSPDSEETSKPSPPAAKPKRTSSSKASKPRAEAPASKPAPQMQFTPPMDNDDLIFHPPLDGRDPSLSPPSYQYAPATYPEESLMLPYGSTQPPYHSLSVDSYPSYLSQASMPSTVPSMTHFSDAFSNNKRDSYSSDSQYGPPYNNFYQNMDVPSSYDQSNPHTPPLTHSFDHSANCSEAGLEYPATPLSLDESLA